MGIVNSDKPLEEIKGQMQTIRNDENRGKVRHGLTVALAPLVAQEMMEINKLKAIVNELTEYVMEGK